MQELPADARTPGPNFFRENWAFMKPFEKKKSKQTKPAKLLDNDTNVPHSPKPRCTPRTQDKPICQVPTPRSAERSQRNGVWGGLLDERARIVCIVTPPPPPV